MTIGAIVNVRLSDVQRHGNSPKDYEIMDAVRPDNIKWNKEFSSSVLIYVFVKQCVKNVMMHLYVSVTIKFLIAAAQILPFTTLVGLMIEKIFVIFPKDLFTHFTQTRDIVNHNSLYCPIASNMVNTYLILKMSYSLLVERVYWSYCNHYLITTSVAGTGCWPSGVCLADCIS